MKKARTKKTTKRKRTIKLNIWIIVLGSLVLFVFAILVRDLSRERRIAMNGIIRTAYIYNYTHGRGSGEVYYHFYYPDTWHIWEGRCAGGKEYRLGQAIDVMFLPDNPRINRPWSEMKKKVIVKKRLSIGDLKEPE